MANTLLYPQNTETRRKIRLDGLWKFKFDAENIGEENNWQAGLKEADWIPVPSSFNDLYTKKDIREYTGAFWYEREFTVPKEWQEKDLDLRFGSVTHKATIYINGKKVTEHLGGYTPFNVPIQGLVSHTQKNSVVIRVSNALSDVTLPVGKTTKNLRGIPITTTATDFFNYSGIQRSVDLVATPQTTIKDISFSFGIEHEEKKANIDYEVEATHGDEIVLEIYDQENILVAVSEGKSGTIKIEEAHLWEPLNSYLYMYKCILKKENKVLDVYSDRLGIRSVEVDEGELLINKKPVYLKGYVKPEKSEIHGAGANLVVTKRDFELMKWSGANAFRTSQFPHDEEVYRLADEEGFIIINELPAIGMAIPKPNRFQPDKGKGQEPFFELRVVQEVTKDHHLSVLSELIKRDKNYASVCIWAVMNEPDTDANAFTPYAEEVLQATRDLDPQKRPVTILFDIDSLENTPDLTHLVDVIAINEYYGWEELGGYELSDAQEKLSSLLNIWEEMAKPIIITGYGAEALQGEMKLPSVQWSENYQNEVFHMQHQLFDQHPMVQGELVWSFSDYQTPEGLTAIGGNNSGIFTDSRQPKTAAYLLKDRWHKEETEK